MDKEWVRIERKKREVGKNLELEERRWGELIRVLEK